MPEKTSLAIIAQAVQDALDITDESVAHVLLQFMQTGYAIGLADGQKAG